MRKILLPGGKGLFIVLLLRAGNGVLRVACSGVSVNARFLNSWISVLLCKRIVVLYVAFSYVGVLGMVEGVF